MKFFFINFEELTLRFDDSIGEFLRNENGHYFRKIFG